MERLKWYIPNPLGRPYLGAPTHSVRAFVLGARRVCSLVRLVANIFFHRLDGNASGTGPTWTKKARRLTQVRSRFSPEGPRAGDVGFDNRDLSQVVWLRRPRICAEDDEVRSLAFHQGSRLIGDVEGARRLERVHAEGLIDADRLVFAQNKSARRAPGHRRLYGGERLIGGHRVVG